MAYSGTGDLLTGNIPTPTYLDPNKFVNDAADEIDSKIGFVYKTPITFLAEGQEGYEEQRPARLLLKRLNNFLATGRLLMAVDAGGENDRLHAYGASLVRDALEALNLIAEGKVTLHGVDRNQNVSPQQTAPLIDNLDSESNVEAFYDRIANPGYLYPPVGSRLIG